MRDTGARVVLVHPTLLNTARRAARTTSLTDDRLFVFSVVEQEPVHGIRDWRSIMLDSAEEASSYDWQQTLMTDRVPPLNSALL